MTTDTTTTIAPVSQKPSADTITPPTKPKKPKGNRRLQFRITPDGLKALRALQAEEREKNEGQLISETLVWRQQHKAPQEKQVFQVLDPTIIDDFAALIESNRQIAEVLFKTARAARATADGKERPPVDALIAKLIAELDKAQALRNDMRRRAVRLRGLTPAHHAAALKHVADLREWGKNGSALSRDYPIVAEVLEVVVTATEEAK